MQFSVFKSRTAWVSETQKQHKAGLGRGVPYACRWTPGLTVCAVITFQACYVTRGALSLTDGMHRHKRIKSYFWGDFYFYFCHACKAYFKTSKSWLLNFITAKPPVMSFYLKQHFLVAGGLNFVNSANHTKIHSIVIQNFYKANNTARIQ